MRKLVGIRPTGQMHLGHYFSVIKPALEFGCDVLIAHYHAPDKLYSNEGIDLVNELLSFGISSSQIVSQQIDSALFFKMLALSPAGVLGDMTQYKYATKQNAHLFIYPVLMAHDIVGYDEVCVGDDQKQHLEFANKILKKMGHPKVKMILIGGRIMSLSNPMVKMSKSDPKGCLFLSDSPDVITQKIKKAVTDKTGIKNLEKLYKEFVGGHMPEKNSEMKSNLSQGIIRRMTLRNIKKI